MRFHIDLISNTHYSLYVQQLERERTTNENHMICKACYSRDPMSRVTPYCPYMESTAVFRCSCTVAYGKWGDGEFSSLFSISLSRYYRTVISPILLFCLHFTTELTQTFELPDFGSCTRGKRKCRDRVTSHKLTARITRFVNL